ncbi:spike [Enterobacteria phage PR4]|uniref:Spike n=1 Tax=Enterobacteria phage PR4 TaxID=318595 RepID=Q3T4Y3_9VIRU|nr:major spike protein [Enterobacteria phage PR4]AAX45614.1 spike [Enterobacteria phage PR4]
MANQQIGGSTVTYNGAIPMGGPVAINTVIEIDQTEVLVDLKLDYATGKISGVQTLYIDLRDFLGDVTVTMPDTGQRITARAGTQGYYPVLSTNLMKFVVSATIDGKFPMNFINFPIALGVWPSGIKGDKGDPGEPGPAGGTVVVEDSGAFGESLLDTASDPGKILVKRISAGSGITLTDYGDEIEIEATGGGGGGGGGVTDALSLFYTTSSGGPASIAANALTDFDLSGALELNKVGTGMTKAADGIQLAAGKSGLYQVTMTVKNNTVTTGNYLLRVKYGSNEYVAACPASTLTAGGTISLLIYCQVLGVPSLDVLKFSLCNDGAALSNYIINITAAKIN